MGVSGFLIFVGEAFGDFFPGGVALGVQEFGDVVDDDDVAVASAFAAVGQAAAVAHEDFARAWRFRVISCCQFSWLAVM